MRRKERELSQGEAIDIMLSGDYGILSTCGADGVPYGVPLSYVWIGDRLYFHGAPSAGHKAENMGDNPKVCFTVVKPGSVQTLPARFSTLYSSAIAFGTAEEVYGEEKRAALRALADKYAPGFQAEGEAYINRAFHKVAVWGIEVTRLTGKARKE